MSPSTDPAFAQPLVLREVRPALFSGRAKVVVFLCLLIVGYLLGPILLHFPLVSVRVSDREQRLHSALQLSAVARARSFSAPSLPRASEGGRRAAWSAPALPFESRAPRRPPLSLALPESPTAEEASDPAPALAQQGPTAEDDQLHVLREQLVQRVSGLDRGLAASSEDVLAVDAAARALEFGPGVRAVDWASNDDLAKLDGTWRLEYTSAFATGSLGGERPGPPSNSLLRIGKVLQRIRTREGRLDNIIEPLYIDAPMVLLSTVLPAPAATVELGHVMELEGSNEVRITGDGGKVEPYGLRSFSFERPKLPFTDELTALLPKEARDALRRVESSIFRVVYLDDAVRVTRGDRGELRVFVREGHTADK